MPQYGIKIWSKDVYKNPEFFRQCVKAVKEQIFNYIELFVIADTFDETSGALGAELNGLPVIIHAPHASFGLNTGDRELETSNRHQLRDSRRFADLLHSETIILHAGEGEGETYINETIRQFRLINDPRITLENLPYQCSSTHKILHGSSVEEVRQIIAETGCQFCLDFSHAVCASNHHQLDVYKELERYNALHPVMYHLCDGDINSEVDQHLHYGEGNYDLKRIHNQIIRDNAPLTLETGHEIPQDITPWLNDLHFLQSL